METTKYLCNLRCEEEGKGLHKCHEKIYTKRKTFLLNTSDDYGTQTPIRDDEKIKHTVKGNCITRNKNTCKKCETIENKKGAVRLHKYSNHRALYDHNWYNGYRDHDSVFKEVGMVNVGTNNSNILKVDAGILASDEYDMKTKLQPTRKCERSKNYNRLKQEIERVSSTVECFQDESYTDNIEYNSQKKKSENYECGDDEVRSRKKTQKFDYKRPLKRAEKIKVNPKNEHFCNNNRQPNIWLRPGSDIEEDLKKKYENMFRKTKTREIYKCTSELGSKSSIELPEPDVHKRCKTLRKNTFEEKNLDYENRNDLKKKRRHDGCYKQHLPKQSCNWKNIKKWTKKHDSMREKSNFKCPCEDTIRVMRKKSNFKCPCEESTEITYQKKIASQHPDPCKQGDGTVPCIQENNLQKCTCKVESCNEILTDPEDFEGFCYKLPLPRRSCRSKYNNTIRLETQILNKESKNFECHCERYQASHKSQLEYPEPDTYDTENNLRRNMFDKNYHENKTCSQNSCNIEKYYKQPPLKQCRCKNIKNWAKKNGLSKISDNIKCPCEDTPVINYPKKIASEYSDLCKQNNNLKRNTSKDKNTKNVTDLRQKYRYCKQFLSNSFHRHNYRKVWTKKHCFDNNANGFQCPCVNTSELIYNEHNTLPKRDKYGQEKNSNAHIFINESFDDNIKNLLDSSNTLHYFEKTLPDQFYRDKNNKTLPKKQTLNKRTNASKTPYEVNNELITKTQSVCGRSNVDSHLKEGIWQDQRVYKSTTDSQDSSSKCYHNQQLLPKQCCRSKNIKVWTKRRHKNEETDNLRCPCKINKIPCRTKMEPSDSKGRYIDESNYDKNLPEKHRTIEQIGDLQCPYDLSKGSQFNSITDYNYNKEKNHPGHQNIDKNIETTITKEERNQLVNQLPRSKINKAQNCSNTTEKKYNSYPNEDLAYKSRILSCADTQTSNSFIESSAFSRTCLNQTDLKAKCTDVNSSDYKIECKPEESESRTKDSMSDRNVIKRKRPHIMKKMRCLCTRGHVRDLNSFKTNDDDLANKNVQWYKDLKNQPEHALASCFKNKVIVKNNLLRSKKFVSHGLQLKKVGQLIPFIKGLKISLRSLSKNTNNKTIINI
ncbi:unnamed protein product [Arctia plantaginis]|uniref:Uncharacterized protein n=1 Tax=Arctia plantaginis TaxID=874455 RepID=A0A8S1A857_ARCPL|nr:unnamed protein product [Arctia plantaginis]